MPSLIRRKAWRAGWGKARVRMGDRERPSSGSGQEGPTPTDVRVEVERTKRAGVGSGRTERHKGRDEKDAGEAESEWEKPRGAEAAGQGGERREAPAVPLRSWPCRGRSSRGCWSRSPRCRLADPGRSKPARRRLHRDPDGGGASRHFRRSLHALPAGHRLALCGRHVGCGAADKARLRCRLKLGGPPGVPVCSLTSSLNSI